MNSHDVIVALIVATPAMMGLFASPVAVVIAGRQRRADKLEDWRRQDVVADRVEAAAAAAVKVAEQAKKAAADLLASNAQVAETTRENADNVTARLAQIHDLVNSTLTSALEDQLLARQQLLVLLLKDIARDQVDGVDVLPETLAAVHTIEAVVADLTGKLQDRARQTLLADSNILPTT